MTTKRDKQHLLALAFALSASLTLACCSRGVQTEPTAAFVSGLRPAGAQAVAVRPRRLIFTGSGDQGARVTIVGGEPPFTLRQTNPAIAVLHEPHQRRGAWVFQVVPIAHGTTVATVTDARGSRASLWIREKPVCEPPTPDFYLLFPDFTSKQTVPVRVGKVFMVTGTDMQNAIPEFFVNLAGSDGTSVQGSHFAVTTATPPPGSGNPPGASWNVFSTASVPRLRPRVTYTVQFADLAYQCLPPLSSGTFTTE